MSAGAYDAVMARKADILRAATGIDYSRYTDGPVIVDYAGLMASTGYDATEVRSLQRARGVGGTPMLELRNVTRLVRELSPPGHGARILVKDEAANPSGSFKDRRASISAHHAKKMGYAGLVAATSGNYGAAVASQAAAFGLGAIVIQEAYDGDGRGQPEILEKARKCEALGAEVIQTTVGPELFFMLLKILEETGWFNASLYTPFSVQGIETLGEEIVEDSVALTGRRPAMVLCTHAGGGMCTGVARGLRNAGSEDTQVVGVSVDLTGLHMASDHDFNRKSFTTGHTGFSVPFTSWPDRADVPRNAARSLRYLDRFVTVSQGSVFFATELLAQAEGLERGPAGNISLAAALVLARELPRDELLVVTETEYTGAGKTPWAQLAFARDMGVDVVNGGPESEQPGAVIALPLSPTQLACTEVDLGAVRRSYIRHAMTMLGRSPGEAELAFLAEDTRLSFAELADLMTPATG
ncbi:MAG: pyridoxal-phosphate dependent enzyme [Streptosporangiales bacterium]|nr:pyridoxal-phosphate dependent enzyme [Streptosporangiales bacterium]